MATVAESKPAEKAKKDTHRGHGEGTVVERNGKFRAQILVEGKRLGDTFATKTEARNWLRKTKTDADEGMLPVDGGKVTVGDFLEKWLAAITPSIKPKTIEQYTSVIRLHLKPSLGAMKLVDLRADHVQSLSAAKLAENKSPRTVQLILSILHHALRDAVRWRLVPRNVGDAVTKPRPRRHEMVVWTPEQARTFLTGVRGDRWEALYHLALSCGLRAGELLGLKWDDVDLDRARLQVRRIVQRAGKGNGLIVGEPKTAKGRRSIVLPGSVVAILRQWRIRQIEERLVAGPAWQDLGYVFASHVGTATEPRRLKTYFDAHVERLQLPRIRFHDLRHTCATLLLTRGIHPKVVQEMLGHSQISMTMDTYSHVLPSMQEDAARTMEAVLGGA